MLDLRRLLSGMTSAIREEVPDAAYLAKALDLDISRSRIVDAKSVLGIRDAILDGDIEIDALWGRPPYREICLVIKRVRRFLTTRLRTKFSVPTSALFLRATALDLASFRNRWLGVRLYSGFARRRCRLCVLRRAESIPRSPQSAS